MQGIVVDTGQRKEAPISADGVVTHSHTQPGADDSRRLFLESHRVDLNVVHVVMQQRLHVQVRADDEVVQVEQRAEELAVPDDLKRRVGGPTNAALQSQLLG